MNSTGQAWCKIAMYFALSAVCLVPHVVAGAEISAPPNAADVPIRIERCLIESRSELRDPFNGMRANYISGLAIQFENVRAVAAILVRFTVRYQGSSETIVERGSFTSNVPIDRAVSLFAGTLGSGGAADCDVSAVNYQDGTTWNRER